jgi:hypothetical protein
MFEYDLIIKAVQKAETEIKAKNLTKEQIKELNKKLDLSPLEYANFQQIKSEFQAMNILSLSSAQWIYNKLSHYSKTSLAEKWVLTQLFALMLKLKPKLTEHKTLMEKYGNKR